jgi:hypothetical protein
VLRYAMQYTHSLCCTLLHPTVLHCALLYPTTSMHSTVLYCTVPHLQADAFKDENSKRRTLEKQMDALCQQVGCWLQELHGMHGLHGVHGFFKRRQCTQSLQVTAHSQGAPSPATHACTLAGTPRQSTSSGCGFKSLTAAMPLSNTGVYTQQFIIRQLLATLVC